MDKKEFIWDWLKHENAIFNTRSSIFVVAEIIMVGYVASSNSLYPFFLMGLGAILTLLWILVNFKHIYGTHCQVQKALKKEKEFPYAELVEQRNCFPWSNHFFLGILIPFVFLAVWIILFVFKLRSGT